MSKTGATAPLLFVATYTNLMIRGPEVILFYLMLTRTDSKRELPIANHQTIDNRHFWQYYSIKKGLYINKF